MEDNEVPTNTDACADIALVDNSASDKKTTALIDIANSTFRELCKTLEYEQSKLMELEGRRQVLQEEMKLLRLELEHERESLEEETLQVENSVSAGDTIATESVHEFIDRQREAIQKLKNNDLGTLAEEHTNEEDGSAIKVESEDDFVEQVDVDADFATENPSAAI